MATYRGRSRVLLAALFGSLLLTSGAARAQVDLLHESRLGSLYLSGSPGRYVDYKWPEMDTPFNFYLLIDVDFSEIDQAAQNQANGIQAWEVRVPLPPSLFILSATLSPPTAINFGSNIGNTYDFVVGTGTAVPAGGIRVLVTFQALMTNIFRENVSPGPIENPTIPGEAVWVESLPSNGCSVNGLAEACQFRFAEIGRLRMGVPPMAGEVESFSAMKARF